MTSGQDPATWDWDVSTSGRTQAEEQAANSKYGGVPSRAVHQPQPTGALMQTTLQAALQDCLESSMAPEAATIDGVSMMGFPGVSDETLKQLELTVKAWLHDALNAGLLPSEAEAWAIIEAAFKTYLSASMGPIMARFVLLGLKYVVAELYQKIDT